MNKTLSKIKRSTWALVEPNAQVAAFDGQGRLIQNTAERYAFTSDSAMREPDGRAIITLARDARLRRVVEPGAAIVEAVWHLDDALVGILGLGRAPQLVHPSAGGDRRHDANVPLADALDPLGQALEARWVEAVVGAQELGPLEPTQRGGPILVLVDAGVGGPAVVAQARVAVAVDDRGKVVGRRVVADDQLPRRVCLAQHTLDGPRQPPSVVPDRDEDRERDGHRGFLPICLARPRSAGWLPSRARAGSSGQPRSFSEISDTSRGHATWRTGSSNRRPRSKPGA